jgi:cytochrome P450
LTNNEQLIAKDDLIPSLLGSGNVYPYPLYSKLRTSKPICRDSSGTWLISSHALIVELLREHDAALQTVPLDEEVTCARRAFQRQSGADHTRLRAAMSSLFSSVSAESLRASTNGDARELLRAVAPATQFDLSVIAFALALRTAFALLGISREEGGIWLKACLPAARAIADPQLNRTTRDDLKKGVDEFSALVDRFISGVERDGKDRHPLHRLLQLEAQGVLSRNEIIDNVAFMFISSFATTARGICNTVVPLLRNRRLWNTCAAEPIIVPKVVREMLRLEGVAHGVVRYALEDIKVGGNVIRRGEELILLLASANRDPHAFNDPQSVDLNRPSVTTLTFGAGAHACIGRMLAMMEIEAVVLALLDIMPCVTLLTPHTAWRQSGLVQGYTEVWLRTH